MACHLIHTYIYIHSIFFIFYTFWLKRENTSAYFYLFLEHIASSTGHILVFHVLPFPFRIYTHPMIFVTKAFIYSLFYFIFEVIFGKEEIVFTFLLFPQCLPSSIFGCFFRCFLFTSTWHI